MDKNILLNFEDQPYQGPINFITNNRYNSTYLYTPNSETLCIQTPYLKAFENISNYENRICLLFAIENKECLFIEYMKQIEDNIIKNHIDRFGEHQQENRFMSSIMENKYSVPFAIRMKLRNLESLNIYNHRNESIKITTIEQLSNLFKYQKMRCIFEYSGLYYQPGHNTNINQCIQSNLFQPILKLLSIQFDEIKPRYIPNKFSFIDKSTDICSICMQSIDITNGYSVLKCNHTFHINCLNNWFQKDTKQTCPNCRINHN